MAEVSLRLLRSKARPHTIEERLLCGRKHGGSLFLLCQVPTGVVVSEDSHRLRFYTLWPSGTHRGRCLARQMNPSQEVRLYSQWSGSRASYHQYNHRRNGPNGAQDLGAPLYKSRTGYYDILEVTGSATQSQIKTAYYKQSFRFHPDRNSGNEDAARLFGMVTEAYHVLGSASLRKKYDRGILSLDDVRSAKKPSVKSSSPSLKEAGGQREASTTSNSNTPAKPMFDFDAFYQAHYGEQLARERSWKARREDIEKRKLEKKTIASFNKLGELSALLLFVSATIMIVCLR
ncbi:dnaJ homolog subfamily C member 30, mitochondrial [Bufo gargarizans]|uniref:dnaJ homolog subfamily C member 30, mitochondrial n=1 Tax=Bufo gargarizans TaxID=30331 RepID=UPI001CF21B85|nr:dnaJ homolog subfamily C member 30, mitochondrial [Bufo gargarizans]